MKALGCTPVTLNVMRPLQVERWQSSWLGLLAPVDGGKHRGLDRGPVLGRGRVCCLERIPGRGWCRYRGRGRHDAMACLATASLPGWLVGGACPANHWHHLRAQAERQGSPAAGNRCSGNAGLTCRLGREDPEVLRANGQRSQGCPGKTSPARLNRGSPSWR
jgi:hypothetical protein